MSFTKLFYHVIFSPKNRENLIRKDIQRDVYKILFESSKENQAFVHRIGGTSDHVHMLIELPPMVPLSDFMQNTKKSSSHSLKSLIRHWPGWQEGYGGFTCSYREIDIIKQYIINQEEHHKTISFKDEYRQWLIENGISPDAPYFPK